MPHIAYAAAWTKLEPMWDFIIRTRQIVRMLPLLEAILEGTDKGSSRDGLASRRATSFPRANATVGPEDVPQRIRPIEFAGADLFD